MTGQSVTGKVAHTGPSGGRDAFDLVVGSSAGAINSTYFLAGQREGVDIYHEDIANEQFIDMRRLVHWSSEQSMSSIDL